MFYLLTSIFGFMTVPGLIQSACGNGNTLLYISAWGYVISAAIALIGDNVNTNTKK